MSRTILVLFVGLLCFPARPFSQSVGYEVFAHYSSENGLPQNSITGIKQDKNGFIWLTTNGGLVRFDGHDFKTFNMARYHKAASNRLHNIFEYKGKLVAEEWGLNAIFEITDENSITVRSRDSLAALPRMGTWYKMTKQLSNYKKQYKLFSHYELITDSKGSAGYSTLGDVNNIYFYQYPAPPVDLHIQSWRNMDNTFVINKRLYVIDKFSELVCFEGAKKIKAGGSFATLVRSASGTELKESRLRQTGGFVYFSTSRGVYLLKESAPGIVEAEMLTNSAVQPDKSTFLYIPAQKILLIGTGNDGLYLYRQRQFNALLVPEQLPDYFDQTKYFLKPNNVFYPVAELNDSTVLTTWGGITMSQRIIPVNKIVFEERNIPVLAPGLFIGEYEGDHVPRITDQHLNDMGVFDPGTDIKNFGHLVHDKDTFYFRLLINDKWVLRKYKYTPPLRIEYLDEYPLPDLDAYDFVKYSRDTIWVASSRGLYSINTRQKTSSFLDGLKQAVVRKLYYDREGNLWIGTYGKGWYRWNKNGLVRLFVDRNAYLENVHAFLEDDAGYLWVSTNNGLFRFLKTDLEKANGPDQQIFFNYFTKEYGFYSNEFNGGSSPSAWKMSNGKFVFPGMKGLVMFNPMEVPLEQPSYRILTSEYTLDSKPIDSLEGVILDPGFNNIALKVFVPYFGQHYNLQLEYQLSSGTGSWTRLPENGIISFNRLTHGYYTLTIRMLKGFGSGEYVKKEIHFSVAPKWYQTKLFIVLASLLLASLIIVYVRWRTRKIKYQKELLEKEVQLRTEALKASEEKVRQNARFKSQVTSLVLHDVRSPLYYLNKITQNIYQSTEGKVPEHIREELKDLHLSVKDIAAYAQTLFAWINAQQDDFVLRPARIGVAALLDEVCNNYQLLAAQNKNSIACRADGSLQVTTQADLLQIVVRNLVDNAIKFTNNGQIILSAEQKNEGVQITVSDTGKGMAADRVERILGNDSEEIADTRSGMGYRLIRDLLKKMGGRLSVISEPGKGSAVTILLPLSP